MTIDEIKAMDCDFLSAATVASVMRMDVGRLIGYARNGELPFPVQQSGNRIKISRVGFLNWVTGKPQEPEREDPERKNGIEKQLEALTKEIRIVGAILMGILLHNAPEIAGKLMDQQEKEGLQ